MPLPDRNDYQTGEDTAVELCLLCRGSLTDDEEGICRLCLGPLVGESEFQDKLREVVGCQRIMLRQVSLVLRRAYRLLDGVGLGRDNERRGSRIAHTFPPCS